MYVVQNKMCGMRLQFLVIVQFFHALKYFLAGKILAQFLLRKYVFIKNCNGVAFMKGALFRQNLDCFFTFVEGFRFAILFSELIYFLLVLQFCKKFL